jgi:hypothetical protein
MRYGEAEIEQHGWEQVAEWLHEDERLLQRWRDDELWYINVGAVAVVEVSEDGEHWASERLEEYVCGVEYDLGNARNDEYLRDIHKSQLDAIRHELRWWGFTDDEIDQAFGNPDEIAVVEED